MTQPKDMANTNTINNQPEVRMNRVVDHLLEAHEMGYGPIVALDGFSGQAHRTELIRLMHLLAASSGYNGNNTIRWYTLLIKYKPTPEPQVNDTFVLSDQFALLEMS